jgi:hypothetical protein
MEKIRDLYHQYLDHIITWYKGLDQLYQDGVFYLLIIVCFCIIVYFILSRVTK